MAIVTYGKSIMASVIMAKILWQMKLSLGDIDIKNYIIMVFNSNLVFKL